MENIKELKARSQRLVARLTELYPDSHCALCYQSPLQLLIATILSAQCTDARVNMVTPKLFERYPTSFSLAEAKPNELESIIRSTGFYKNKAKNIIACCKALVKDHKGEVPKTMEELVVLSGVGRKTANVVLGNAFGIPGLPVDTHVGRLSFRLGLSKSKDPVKIELDLHKLVKKEDWTLLGHRIIEHGRKICASRKPKCADCALIDLCPQKGITKTKTTTKGKKKS
ncbi:MAG: endonuclease III [Planctomycetes bacterium]|nr:endonuclease III [Planctomycetota bacterium]NBY01038.1 endonuclease III [Planctomycetota bacterium]